MIEEEMRLGNEKMISTYRIYQIEVIERNEVLAFRITALVHYILVTLSLRSKLMSDSS